MKTDTMTAGVSDTNVAALKTVLGDGWPIERILQLRDHPLQTIEDALNVCTLAPNGTRVFNAALTKWKELSRAEIEAAQNLPAAEIAFLRIPVGEDRVDRELVNLAISKCAEYHTSFGLLENFLEACRAGDFKYCEHAKYPRNVLNKLFSLATEYDNFLYLHSNTPSLRHNLHSDEDRRAAELMPGIEEKLRATFKVELGKMKTSDEALVFHEKKVPHELKDEFFGRLLNFFKLDEAGLRKLLEIYCSKSEQCLRAQVTLRLDVIMQEAVSHATNLEDLKALTERCQGLYTSGRQLQQKIDGILKTAELKKAISFADYKTIYLGTADDETRRACWKIMKILAELWERGEELWKCAEANPDHCRSEFKAEAEAVWLMLAGDDSDRVNEVYLKTHGIDAYKKKLSLVTSFSAALDAWGQAHNEAASELGFECAVRCVVESADWMELLAKIVQRGSGQQSVERTDVVVARVLELAKTKEEILRLVRSVKYLSWDARMLIVVRLAKFYPVEQAEQVTAPAA